MEFPFCFCSFEAAVLDNRFGAFLKKVCYNKQDEFSKKGLVKMIAFIQGTVHHILPDSCIVDVHGVGYQIFVAHPYEFKPKQEVFFYTFHYVKEDINALYGFLTMEEKELYNKLLSVKGVGPKVAMTMLAATTPNQLLQAIDSEDVTYLKKIPGIGPKAAGQIIFDLRGKLVNTSAKLVSPILKEASEALAALGYTKKEIDFAFKNVTVTEQSVEDIVRLGLKNLMG